MTTPELDAGWHKLVLQPRLPWFTGPILPADVIHRMRDVMFSKENLLEDAQYHKVAPNHYVIELSPANYARNYQPIEARVIQQWREKLLEYMATANSRQGRREYRFAGPVRIEIRSAADLTERQARVLSRLDPAEAPPPNAARKALPACLELTPSGRRWPLYPGVITLGRDPECDVYLDQPEVQERRLVSGQHAYLRCELGKYTLFDGSPTGRPSVNGTYVNGRRVGEAGTPLRDGDQILLASLLPDRPTADTPGVVALRFRMECKP